MPANEVSSLRVLVTHPVVEGGLDLLHRNHQVVQHEGLDSRRELLERVSPRPTFSRGTTPAWSRGGRGRRGRPQRPQPPQADPQRSANEVWVDTDGFDQRPPEEVDSAAMGYQPGMRVRHVKFGEGEVRSITGGLVRRLAQGMAAPGIYTAMWDGRDERGRPVATGAYFCVLRVGPLSAFRRLVVLR